MQKWNYNPLPFDVPQFFKTDAARYAEGNPVFY